MSKENYSRDTYSVVLNEDKSPLFDDGKVVLQSISDGNRVYVSLNDDIVKEFGINKNDYNLDDSKNGDRAKNAAPKGIGKNGIRKRLADNHKWRLQSSLNQLAEIRNLRKMIEENNRMQRIELDLWKQLISVRK